jgi:carboxymethylenebutenolidase
MVYPERSTRAPVVVVIHEGFGLTAWVLGVTDQLAADGFIAIAPDLLAGTRLPKPPDSLRDGAGGPDATLARIGRHDPAQVVRRVEAAGRYGTGLPAAVERWGVVGFGWGGSLALATAAGARSLGAAVSFYGGVAADPADLSGVRAPTLALLAEDDAAVNTTMPYADSSYRAANARFEQVTFAGAGHGFLRAQDEGSGANRRAAREGWRRALAWFRRHLGR